jgi:hypothetical protein
MLAFDLRRRREIRGCVLLEARFRMKGLDCEVSESVAAGIVAGFV